MSKKSGENMAAVILAAGQGTRMQSANVHKVCFPVAGVPAINRLVGTLRDEGAGTVVLVVGALAGDVMHTVGGAFPETLFALQAKQHGTGDAARCGFAPLESMGFDAPVLVTYGDKVIAPGVVQRLSEEFHRSRCDAAFVVSEKSGGDQARVALAGDGHVEWIIETSDIDQATMMARLRAACKGKRRVSKADLRAAARRVVTRQSKREKLLGPLARRIAGDGTVSAADLLAAIPEEATMLETPAGPITPAQVRRRARHVNEAVYLFRPEALSEGLSRLTARTAQGEEYLPDVLTYLVRACDASGERRFKVKAMVLEDPQEILAFNTPDQLVTVEAAITQREKKTTAATRRKRNPVALSRGVARKAGQWLAAFTSGAPKLRRALRRIYGNDDALIAHRIQAYTRVLKLFVRRYGADREAVISRAPGRVNLMGRHVEHRGGYINPMAINREVLMVAAPREDDVVNLTNVDRRSFPDRRFSISGELSLVPWEDWLSYINSRRVQQMVLDAHGDWANYVKAACLRLQQSFRSVRLRGLDAAVVGDIPQAAGLSSSSAIVVAAGEATIACNRLDITASDFVDLCGEGEWYVGSRGGAGDHAAMKFGRRAQVSRVRFFPFDFEYVPGIGDAHRLVVFNSQVKAQKSSSARDVFNQKVAAYEFGLMMVLDRFPHFAHLVEHLRDLNAERLHIRPHVIYEILLTLPQSMTRAQLRETLSAGHRERAETIFETHGEPRNYDIRSVMLYGLAECARSERAGELLRRGDLAELGRTMCVSHDGDRVARASVTGTMVPFDYKTPDATLRRLLGDLQSEQPERVEQAQLYRQPGGYACSVPEIDQMADVAMATDGVLGAQLSGAGLGGCMMVLCRADAVDRLRRRMSREVYKPRGLKPDYTVCRPIEGSGLLAL